MVLARHGTLRRGPATTRLVLVCHGSSAAVRASAFSADEPLDAQGRQRAAALAPHLHRAGRCLTSPALRARQTAEALQLEATVEPMLRDCDYGRWTGRSFDGLQAEEPEAVAEWLNDPQVAPHGGESISRLLDRAAAWLEEQGRLPGRAIAVTHAAFIRAAVIHAIGAPPQSFWRIDTAPLSLTTLNGTDGRWTLSSIGRAPVD